MLCAIMLSVLYAVRLYAESPLCYYAVMLNVDLLSVITILSVILLSVLYAFILLC
jgi:hypothetical protein